MWYHGEDEYLGGLKWSIEQVKVSELVDFFDHIYIIHGSEAALNREIYVSDLSRPGVELTGYFTYYPHDRVQLFGRTEMTFFEEMTPEERTIILRRMCYPKPPAFFDFKGI